MVAFLFLIKLGEPANVCPPAGKSHLKQYLRTQENSQTSQKNKKLGNDLKSLNMERAEKPS